MKKQPLQSIFEKRCSFWLADIDIFVDLLFLEKRKTKGCRTDSCRSSIFKKDQGKQYEKNNCPVHQIKKYRKRQDSFGLCSFYIHGKEVLKGVLVTKENLKSDLNTISDLIRDEKFVDFYRIGKYFEDSAWAECLKLFNKKKKFKMVLFSLSENNCHEY